MSAIQMLMTPSSSTASIAADIDKKTAQTEKEINTDNFNDMIALLLQGFMPQNTTDKQYTDTPSFSGGFSVDPALLVFENGVPTLQPDIDLSTLPTDILKALTPGIPDNGSLQPIRMDKSTVSTTDTRLIASGLTPAQLTEFQSYLAQNFMQEKVPATELLTSNQSSTTPVTPITNGTTNPLITLLTTPIDNTTQTITGDLSPSITTDDIIASTTQAVATTPVTETKNQPPFVTLVHITDNAAYNNATAEIKPAEILNPALKVITDPAPTATTNATSTSTIEAPQNLATHAVNAVVTEKKPTQNDTGILTTPEIVTTNKDSNTKAMAQSPATNNSSPVISTAPALANQETIPAQTKKTWPFLNIAGSTSETYDAQLYKTASSGGLVTTESTPASGATAEQSHAQVMLEGKLQEKGLLESVSITAEQNTAQTTWTPDLTSTDVIFSAQSNGPAQNSSPLTTPILQQAHASQSHPATQMVAATLQKMADSTKNTKTSQSIAIQVDPPELGRVYIDVKMNIDNAMEVQMVVEKSDTFMMLKRDSHMIEQALQQAGIKSDGLSLDLQLASDQNAFQQALNGEWGASDNHKNHQQGHNQSSGFSSDSNSPTTQHQTIESTVDWYTDEKTGRLRYNLTA